MKRLAAHIGRRHATRHRSTISPPVSPRPTAARVATRRRAVGLRGEPCRPPPAHRPDDWRSGRQFQPADGGCQPARHENRQRPTPRAGWLRRQPPPRGRRFVRPPASPRHRAGRVVPAHFRAGARPSPRCVVVRTVARFPDASARGAQGLFLEIAHSFGEGQTPDAGRQRLGPFVRSEAADRADCIGCADSFEDAVQSSWSGGKQQTRSPREAAWRRISATTRDLPVPGWPWIRQTSGVWRARATACAGSGRGGDRRVQGPMAAAGQVRGVVR